MKDFIILVDENNNEMGTMEKLEAHEKWLLHRAFSIFIFNEKWELLLQKRAREKYHAGGLWTNTVCSHPRLWENYEQATQRRLQEEMGFICPLEKKGEIIYNVWFLEWNLREHEYDTIFTWKYDGEVRPNKEEVMDYKWVNMEELKSDIQKNKNNYTPWFIEIFKKFY